jgi:hypothetical protein
MLYYFSACNYTYFMNVIRLRLHCLINNRYIILLIALIHDFSLHLTNFFFKQSSATRRKCLTQLDYAHAQGTNREPKRILFIPVGRGRKRICPFLAPSHYAEFRTPPPGPGPPLGGNFRRCLAISSTS